MSYSTERYEADKAKLGIFGDKQVGSDSFSLIVDPYDTKLRKTFSLPLHYARVLPTCCGVLNIGSWYGEISNIEAATLRVWLHMLQLEIGYCATGMVIATTIDGGMDHVEEFLADFGFEYEEFNNANSGNDVKLWKWKLY